MAAAGEAEEASEEMAAIGATGGSAAASSSAGGGTAAGGSVGEMGSAIGDPEGAAAVEGTDAADEGGTEEARPSLTTPVKMPSQREIAEHFASGHARYRSWCPHCVAAKGRNPHT